MTADTSWYGQQTLVHPDSSHQPYAPYGTQETHEAHETYGTHETYGDAYAAHHQYGYAQQQGYAAPYDHGDPYAAGYMAPTPQPTTGYGWPDYYQAQHEPTLVAEYGAYTGHAALHHDYAGYPDYSVYDAVTDVSYATVTAPLLEGFDSVDPFPGDEVSASAAGVTPEAHEGRDAAGSAGNGHALDVGASSGSHAALETEDGSRGEALRGPRRRGMRRRSAVLTIAVPSIAVLGVAGAAAATMGPLRSHHTDTTAASSTTAAQARAQALAASEARDAAQRAARDHARTALQLREAAARKAAAEAPRYVLPIAYHTGLSALFGQAGTHWMQLHTGIDFPVPEGTPVHAVTGGTVTTEWNPFYGYMVKLTAPDGTVTWYCHLSSYRVRSGQVKVGDIIAYSGDTGNSTGPHLHFEVHPDGGPAVDPLPWLLARGLDPR
ncbi:M23 family metallopeptidase [Streptacidiphilus neutrinimicus]|uniref:M23 family metallopeptidase n=1 Tax=Streptacidiphilus neutrinimicus TaxID=105420 RepID=UPI0006943882|nr:M23 family metallopeptidase [Streptacidiphilus neutrinimicus]